MNIRELNEVYPLTADTQDAVSKVEEMTGKPMVFHLVDDLVSHAKLKVARSFMPEHIVFIKTGKVENINHIIIHECYHIFRFWSVSKGKRKVLSTRENEMQCMMAKWRQELGKKGEQYPAQIYTIWQNGIITLFYNAVTDTRIERRMYKEYPQTRDEQLRSLKVMEEEIKAGMSKEIERMVPPSVFLEVGAMNYVFLKQLEPIIGRQWRKAFKGHNEIITLGNRLLRCVADEDLGLSQDIAILEKWASILGYPIGWNDFEDVPANYATQY